MDIQTRHLRGIRKGVGLLCGISVLLITSSLAWSIIWLFSGFDDNLFMKSLIGLTLSIILGLLSYSFVTSEPMLDHEETVQNS